MAKAVEDRLPEVNDVINSPNNKSYRITELLGEGGYGSVFRVRCEDDQKSFALKAEKYSETVLRSELNVLKEAKKRRCTQICELIDFGSVNNEFMFMVMTLLGPDLVKLRNGRPGRRFSPDTAIRVAQNTLEAVHELHQCGFISRDIKPGNFAIGRKETQQNRTFFIFDFGLARRYVDRAWNVMPSRGQVGFRGTTRYASLKAHMTTDLGRRDDIESWFYMMVELMSGALPWRMVVDRELVEAAKKEVRTKTRNDFLKNCPLEFDAIMTIVDQLDYGAPPPYATLLNIFDEIRKTRNIAMLMPYDWETEEEILSPSQTKDMTSPISVNVVNIIAEEMPHLAADINP